MLDEIKGGTLAHVSRYAGPLFGELLLSLITPGLVAREANFVSLAEKVGDRKILAFLAAAKGNRTFESLLLGWFAHSASLQRNHARLVAMTRLVSSRLCECPPK
jgi:hypothetical protein